MSTFTTTLAALALAAAATTPAAAAPLDVEHSVEIRHGDLDLTRTADVARLNRRIVNAAKAVCGTYDIRDLRAGAGVKACRSETIAAASPEVELAVARANGGAKFAGMLPADSISVP